MSRVIVMDNGGHTIKVEYNTAELPRVLPNSIVKTKEQVKRAFVSSQISELKNYSALYYLLPFEKGYLTNWEVQKRVWDHVFGRGELNVTDFDDTQLLFTDPMFVFASIFETLNEVFFEEYGFNSVCRINSPTLSSYKDQVDNGDELCSVIVDCGYSFTHVIPFVHGELVTTEVRRIDVGGKALTNYLKDVISYRQLHVMDETYVVNQMKEDCCYVSQDLKNDMRTCQQKPNPIVRDYVLPDYHQVQRGYMKTAEDTGTRGDKQEQCLRMGIERFAVPEVLFHPSDVHIRQMGVAETICSVIKSFEPVKQPLMYKNIVLTGGSTLFPGFVERVHQEVRAVAEEAFEVNVTRPICPIRRAWQGGRDLSKESETLASLSVTKAEYFEKGQAVCQERYRLIRNN